jgi:YggT family protein
MIAATDPISRLVCIVLWVFQLLLLLRVVASLLELVGVRPPVTGPLRSAWQLLYDVTEPPIRPLRRIVPPAGMFDVAFMVAFVIVIVLQAVFC